MAGWTGYGSDGAYQALTQRIMALERRLPPIQSSAFVARNRRFRLASASTLAIISAGGTLTVTVNFTSPMPSEDYQVDVTVPALAGKAVSNVSVVSRTVDGCTVSCTVPAGIALGVTVIVFALSGPS